MLKDTKEPSRDLEAGEVTTERSDPEIVDPAPAHPKAKGLKKSAQSKAGVRREKKSDTEGEDFDYSRIPDPKLAARARLVAQKILENLRRTGAAVLEIGNWLLEMKDDMDHGTFLPWRNAIFPGSPKTATAWQKIAEVFGRKPDVADRFQPTALGILAYLDAEIRERVLAQIDANKSLTLKQLKALIRTTEAERYTVIEPEESGRVLQLSDETTEEMIVATPVGESGSIPALATVPAVRETRTVKRIRPEAEELPAKYGAPLRELLPILRPQAMKLIDSVEDVVKCLTKALTAAGGESPELRAQLGATLAALYVLVGTDGGTEAGPKSRLGGRWQAIEQTLRRLDKHLAAENSSEGAVVAEEFRRAKKTLAQQLV